MSGSTVRVNLLMEANTQAATANLNKLGTLLHQLGSNTRIGIDSGSISQASQAARDLQMHLGQAVNTPTGKLDLTKFNASLNNSNQNLSQLSSRLLSAGTTGQQAFASLARSIAQAEAPALQLSNAVSSFLKTMGSAVMWSMAYGALNGITQAFSSAVTYAKDLNKALTDIAIVTDLSSHNLSQFAKDAAKAAKELKTTTTAYAEAALIFYQQGLNGDEVKERTDAVIKMANVTGETAKVVSDQMTAIWNNFDNGSKSLEYYADVITALGAATASSTDEIAEGLEKFAAIADTVGLSYEYATTALATVTAKTRQSADVVGTAFKTMFARIQDLELGKTLEDGVSLGQYSQALAAIGVEILDYKGNLRDMDDILNDMGAKWDELSEAQKTATAQSVAGIRQYTQLIALMDNWDEFQINLTVAEGAEGTLEAQQAEWAESAEAAAKQVEQAWNGLYEKLLDDSTVIGFTKGIANLINTFSEVIDHMGGLGPMLLMLFGIFSQKLIPVVANFAQNAFAAFQAVTGATVRQTQATQDAFFADVESLKVKFNINDALAQELTLSKDLMVAKREVEKATKGATLAEKQELQTRLSIYEALNNETLALSERAQASARQAQETKSALWGNNRADYRTQARNARAESIDAQIAAKRAEQKAMSEKGSGTLEDANKYEQLTQDIDELLAKKRELNKEFLSQPIESLVAGQATMGNESFFDTNAQESAYQALQDMGINSQLQDGNLTADVSVDNLEKVIKKRADLSYQLEQNSIAIKEFEQMETQAGSNSITLTEEQQAQYRELAQSMNISEQEAKELDQAMASGNKEKVISIFQRLRQSLSQTDLGLETVSNSMVEFLMSTGMSQEALMQFIQNLNLSEQDAQALAEKIRQLTLEKERMNNAMANNQKMIAGLSTVGKSLGSIAMGLSAVMMLKDALDFSQEMDPLQRVMSILMGISMLMPILTSGLTLLGSLRKKDAVDTGISAAVQAKYNEEKKEEIRLSGEGVVVKGTESTTRAGNTVIIKAETEAIREQQRVKGSPTGGGNSPISGGSTPSVPGGSKTPAPKGGGGGGGAGAGGIGSALGALAAIAAVIAAIVILVKIADNAWNKTKRAMENAAKAANAAKEAYAKASEEHEKLKESVKSYKDGLNAMSKMTQGTLEYREALLKNNETALELISTYSELAGKYETVNGLIVFQEGALEDLEMAQTQRKSEILNYSLTANANARQKRIEYDREQYARKHMDAGYADSLLETNNEDVSNVATGAAVGAGVGAAAAGVAAAVGLLSNPVGWAILAGAAVVGIAGAIIGAFVESEESTSSEQAEIDKLYEAYRTQGAAALEEENMTALLGENSALVQSLDENKEALGNLMKQMKAHEEAVRAETEAMMGNYYAAEDANWSNRSTDEKNVIVEMSADATEAYRDNSQIKHNKYRYVDQQFFGNWSATDKGLEVYRDFLKNARGITNFSDVDFKKDRITFTYNDGKSSEAQQGVITYEELTNWENQQNEKKNLEAKDGEGGSLAEAILTFSNSLGKLDVNGAGLASIISTGELDLRPEDYNQFKINYSNGALTPLIDQYKKILGDSAGEVLDAKIKSAIEDYDPAEALDRFAKKLNAEISSILDAGAASTETDKRALESYTDVLLETTEQLSDYTNEFERLEKKKTAAKLAVSLTKFTKGVRSLSDALEDNKDVFDDWNDGAIETWEAVAQLQEALTDVFGIEVSGAFVKEHFKELQELANGNVDVLKDLSRAAARDYVANLDIDVEGKTALDAALAEIISIEDRGGSEIEIMTALNSDETIAELNNLLATGQVTAEQIQGAFEAIGYSPDIKFETVTQKSVMKVYDGDTTEGKVAQTIVTESEVQVPYIAGKNTGGQKTLGNGQEIANGGTTDSGQGFSSTGSLAQKANALANLKDEKNDELAESQKKAGDEIERYHEIERALKSLGKQYDMLSKKKDRAFGGQRLAYIKQEQEMLKQEEQLLRQQLTEAEAYYNQDKAALAQYGVSFGANGEITNYDEVFAAQLNQYNSDPEAYKDSYEAFKKAITNYENSLDKIADANSKLLENEIKQIDKKMEDISYTVDLKLSLSKDSMAVIEFQLDGLTDTAQDAAEKLSLVGQKMALAISDAETYEQGIKDIFGASNIDFDRVLTDSSYVDSLIETNQLTKDQVEQLRQYRDGLLDSASAMREYKDSISDTLTKAFNDSNEEMEKFSTNIEHTSLMLQGYKDILDLAGRDALGINDKLMVQLAQTQYQVSTRSLDTVKARLQQNEQILKATEAQLNEMKLNPSIDEKSLNEMQEVYDTILLKVQEDQQALQEEMTNTLDALTAAYEEEVESIMRTFEDTMSGKYGNLTQLEASLQRDKELSEQYLQDYEKIYELSKLNRDIVNSIDSNDSVNAKNKLRDIQKEINDLQANNVKLTQYETDEIRARYELRLAEIALEESQNAKSQVRMQRDSEGNWGYIYTANQNDVAAAAQSYEDKLFAYQQLTQERTDEMIDLMASIPKEYEDALNEVQNDATLNDQERAQAILELQNYYQEMYAFAIGQADKSMQHSATVYEVDWKNYSEMTGYKISANEEWVDNFSETVYAQKLGFTSLDEAQQTFVSASDQAFTELQSAYETYQVETKRVLETCLGDLDEFIGSESTPDSLLYYMDQAKKSTDAQTEAAKTMAQSHTQAFSTIVTDAGSWLTSYGSVVEAWCTKNTTLASSINGVIQKYAELFGLANTPIPTPSVNTTANPGLTTKNGGSTSTQSSGSYDANSMFDVYVTASRLQGNVKALKYGDIVGLGGQTKIEYNMIDESYYLQIDRGNGVAEGYYIDKTTATMLKNQGVKSVNLSKEESVKRAGFEEEFGTKQEYEYDDPPTINYVGRTIGSFSGSVDLYAWDGETFTTSQQVDYQTIQATGAGVTDQKKVKGVTYVQAGGWWYRVGQLRGVAALDTGGYTGEWDSSGRIALLHQKELVLNAHDTENFLAGINILRDITAAIDLQALSQRQMLSSLSSSSIDTQSRVLEQQVTITAEFPNATERNEIEAAFDSLLNRASQFANRKK